MHRLGLHILSPGTRIAAAAVLSVAVLLASCEEAAPPDSWGLCGIEEIDRVVVSHDGYFGDGKFPWKMTLQRSGKGTVTVFGVNRSQHAVPLTRDDFRSILQTLRKRSFCHWPERIGKAVPDGSTRTITIEGAAEKERSVKILYLRHEEDSQLIANAVRAWSSIRSHLNLDKAVDVRSYDKKLLSQIGE